MAASRRLARAERHLTSGAEKVSADWFAYYESHEAAAMAAHDYESTSMEWLATGLAHAHVRNATDTEMQAVIDAMRD
eukprot:3852791-Pyramimonas_sp.AAC.1